MKSITTENLPEYKSFLEQATSQIRQARTRSARAVNKEAVSLYWWLGEHIVHHQNQRMCSETLNTYFLHKYRQDP